MFGESCGGRKGRFGTAVVVLEVVGVFVGCCCVFCAGGVDVVGCRLFAGGVEVEVEVDVDVEVDVVDVETDVLWLGAAVLVTCRLTFVHIRPWKVVKFGSDIYDMECWNR